MSAGHPVSCDPHPPTTLTRPRPARLGPLRTLLTGAIRGYQIFLSPLFGPACRYEPSCSEYARQAIERHGALRGPWLAIKRLGRCHPFAGSGYDPVP